MVTFALASAVIVIIMLNDHGDWMSFDHDFTKITLVIEVGSRLGSICAGGSNIVLVKIYSCFIILMYLVP